MDWRCSSMDEWLDYGLCFVAAYIYLARCLRLATGPLTELGLGH